jgi:diguanylate cyclase (GGDEF)-like protein
MSLLSWFDNRTLFGCQCMLAVMFAAVFLWMSRAYPNVRGLRSVAYGFLAGIPCTLLLVARGHISVFLSIIVANALGLLSFLLMYDGVVRFVGGRSRMHLLAAASAACVGVVYYYSEIESSIVPRIIAMGLGCALIRTAMAWQLIRASGSPGHVMVNRTGMRFLGAFMAIMAIWGFDRVLETALHGAPENFMERNSVQTAQMALNVLYIAVFGLCFIVMASHELIARSQQESERDSLSGALNRRGIESRLALELRRSNRSRNRLCVALVDIDHFKRINDSYGHATGDVAIRSLADTMTQTLRDVDFLGRYGGDEFLVVLPETASRNALIVAERLRQAVQERSLPGQAGSLSLSIGITEASPDDDVIALIARADDALYQAKSAGRDCFRMLLPSATFADVPQPRGEQAVAES